ncbi:cytochrome P450 [Phlebopus sp. FC_14]|nr:cytochrome P450 [Phlebopus sp. FC_14]
MSLRQGRQVVVVVVGRMEAATEIMEKEGQALVDRPRSIAAGELLSRGMRVLLQHSGERFRRHRKAMHVHLYPKAAQVHEELQSESARNLIVDILKEPENHQAHAQRFAASVILRLTYGKSTPTSINDPEVVRIYQVMAHFQEAMRPGAFLVDRIPLLRYLPGYGKRLQEYHEFELQLYREQLKRVANEMSKEGAGPSFVRTLLEHVHGHQLSMDEMSYLAGALFGAGSDTTAVAISTMIMAAACYPEAQTRCQDELDTVVGSDRLPTFQDACNLPQLQAFVSESLRWRPVIPIGFAHRATRDIIWRGQCIPAGAAVLGSHWAISRDPTAFPSPEKSNPQRWLDQTGQLRTDTRYYPFGFGRRVCPGQHLALRSLYITLAYLFWSFRIVQRVDAPIDVDAFTDSVISHPAPFRVAFVPRVGEKKLRDWMEGWMG